MKIMVLSDIHGKIEALETAFDIFRADHFDRLFLLGDLLYHGPRNSLPQSYAPAKVARYLNAHADHILAVRGNCDSEVDPMFLDFPIMGDYAVFQMPEQGSSSPGRCIIGLKT